MISCFKYYYKYLYNLSFACYDWFLFVLSFQESLKGPVVNSTLYDLVPATPRIKIHPAETEGGMSKWFSSYNIGEKYIFITIFSMSV